MIENKYWIIEIIGDHISIIDKRTNEMILDISAYEEDMQIVSPNRIFIQYHSNYIRTKLNNSEDR